MEPLTAPKLPIDGKRTDAADPTESPGDAKVAEPGNDVVDQPEAGGDDRETPSTEGAQRAEQDRLLARLEEIWEANKKYELGDLETRHETGSLLNRELGSPDKRQPHGEKTLKLAGERCQVSESELSRMRWFAHLVPSFADLQVTLDRLRTESIRSETPAVRSWTQLKALLPDLKALHALKSGRTPKPAARRARPAWVKFLKLLDGAKDELAQVDSSPDGEARDQLLAKLRELAGPLSDRFRITITIN